MEGKRPASQRFFSANDLGYTDTGVESKPSEIGTIPESCATCEKLLPPVGKLIWRAINFLEASRHFRESGYRA
jgi:hypothetical protein